jgi:hypothetical protein
MADLLAATIAQHLAGLWGPDWERGQWHDLSQRSSELRTAEAIAALSTPDSDSTPE